MHQPPSTLGGALSAALLAAALGGCSYQDGGPPVPILRYDISETTRAKLADEPVGQDQIRGALDMLFGSPANPGFSVVAEWVDEGRNPSYGSEELSDERLEQLWEGNAKAYAKQLANLEAGAFDRVAAPREALDLQSSWGEVRDGFLAIQRAIADGSSQPEALEAYVAEHRQEAVASFREWYPTLRESAELYRQQCLHCHGVEGGGNGPTARFLSPRPRDYRLGKFKWTALVDKARPRRADLYHVIENGVNGTAMLAFKRFPPSQLEGLVDYVRLLSIRGETELNLATDYDSDEGLPIETVQETYLDVWAKWENTAEKVIAFAGEVPRPTPEAIAHGKALFFDAAGANCVKCHGPLARGDGESAYEIDPISGKRVPVKDDWGNPILVRDLNSGIYRGGNRPIDIYRRIFAGINGTPMPEHRGTTFRRADGTPILGDQDMWDLVHYVRSLAATRNRL